MGVVFGTLTALVLIGLLSQIPIGVWLSVIVVLVIIGVIKVAM